MSVPGTGDTLGAASSVSSATSAPGRWQVSTTWVVTLDVLLSGFGSALPELAVAVVTSVAAVEGAVTVTATIAVDPTGIVPILHTSEVVPEHFVLPAAAETNVEFEGMLSVSTTFEAALGPLFATVTVYVSRWPAWAVEPTPVVEPPRSAPPPRQLGKVNEPTRVCQSNEPLVS